MTDFVESRPTNKYSDLRIHLDLIPVTKVNALLEAMVEPITEFFADPENRAKCDAWKKANGYT